MLDRIGRTNVFPKLDQKTGFHQIRIKPEDIEKAAVKTRYGLFEILVMPMGLYNALTTFQTLMDSVFYD